MCESNKEDGNGEQEPDDSKNEDESGMTKEELHKKVREHMEKRKSAYIKMGTVDKDTNE